MYSWIKPDSMLDSMDKRQLCQEYDRMMIAIEYTSCGVCRSVIQDRIGAVLENIEYRRKNWEPDLD